jgi:hypothetical protein
LFFFHIFFFSPGGRAVIWGGPADRLTGGQADGGWAALGGRAVGFFFVLECWYCCERIAYFNKISIFLYFFYF